MNKVIITCDSTCDMTKEQLEEYGVKTIPLYVRIQDDEYRDGVDITSDVMFEKISQCGQLPKTAAVSMQDYLDFWKPFKEEGYEIVHLTISSEMSVCFQNCRMAAEEMGGVYAVDSHNLSTGIGLLVITAANLAREGKSGKEIYDILMEKREKLNVSFVLDTVDYLAKGGRCSAVTAFAAGLLRLRICIEVKDGKMDVCKKYRGKMSVVLADYVRDRLNENVDADLDYIYITDSGVSDEIRQKVKETVLEMRPFTNVLFSTAGCTVSSHCGPGTLGILFFEK
ncbi:MAG: DegV family protein [Clostridia bacterium]|nr:DegV family protein [Clostridia bacterium]MBQ4618767.1 DegV family protein [Clostridia bacterium]MBQ9854618.1 DegV family protein [Clostridia bacterium]